MTIHVNDSGTWRSISQPYVYDNSIWRTISRQYVNDSGVWKKVFPDVGQIYEAGGKWFRNNTGSSYVDQVTPSIFSFNYSFTNTTSSLLEGYLGNTVTVYHVSPQLTYPDYYWKSIAPADHTIDHVSWTGANWDLISTFAIGEDDKLYNLEYGMNTGGQEVSPSPIPALSGTNFIQANSIKQFYGTHPFGLTDSGTIEALYVTPNILTGFNYKETYFFTPPPSLNSNWKYISTAQEIVAGIKNDGTLWIWGRNTRGGLGAAVGSPEPIGFGPYQTGEVNYGRDYPYREYSLTPVTTYLGGTNWDKVEISQEADYDSNYPKGRGYRFRDGGRSSKYSILASKTDGTLWSWGFGELGRHFLHTPTQPHGSTSDWAQTTYGTRNIYKQSVSFVGDNYASWPALAGDTESWSVGIFEKDACAAIKNDGTLWVWGYNYEETLLGTGSHLNALTPVTTFAGGTNWEQIQFGDAYALATKTDGSLWAWGLNYGGRLGTGDKEHRNTPTLIDSGTWSEIAAGNRTSAGIKGNRLYVWGNGLQDYSSDHSFYSDPDEYNHILYNMTKTSAWTPVTTFAGGTDWVSSYSSTDQSQNEHISVCRWGMAAIKSDGSLWTWGSSGDNSTRLPLPILNSTSFSYENGGTPIQNYLGGNDWKTVHLSDEGGIATKTDGTLWIWGYNEFRTLSPSAYVSYRTPTTSSTSAAAYTWKSAKTSKYQTLLLDSSNTLYEMNNLTRSNGIPYQIQTDVKDYDLVKGGTTYTAYGQIFAHITTGGRLYITGNNFHPIAGQNMPIPGSSGTNEIYGAGTNWKQVSIGYDHMAAVKTDGTLWIWGNNGSGQLGTNDTVSRSTPVQTSAGGSTWKHVSCGPEYTAAVKTDGTLWVWGYAGPISDNDEENYYRTYTLDRAYDRWFIGVGRFPQSYTKGTAISTDTRVFRRCSTTSSFQYDEYRFLTPVSLAGNNWNTVEASGASHRKFAETYAEDGTRCGFIATKTDGTLWTWGNRSITGTGHYIDFDATSRSAQVANMMPLQPMEWYFDSNLTSWCQMVNNGGNYQLPTVHDLGPTVKHVSLRKGTYNSTDTIAIIKTDGTLWMWGNSGRYRPNLYPGNISIGSYNGYGPYLFGNYGYFTNKGTSTPIQIGSGTNWKQVSMGNKIGAVATKTDGTLWTWGYYRSPPLQIGSGTNWDSAEASPYGFSAVKTDGTLWVTKSTYPLTNNENIITKNEKNYGFSSIFFYGGDSYLTPLPGGGTDWKAAAPGGANTFMATRGSSASTQKLLLWTNLEHYGEAAYQSTGYTLGNHPLPASLGMLDYGQFFGSLPIVSSGGNWRDFSCSIEHSGAIDYNGTLWMWGTNHSNELGFDDGQLIIEYGSQAVTRPTPVPVTTPAGPWKKISCSTASEWVYSGNGFSNLNSHYSLGNYTLAVKEDGSSWSWGMFLTRDGGDYSTYFGARSGFTTRYQPQLGQRSSSNIRTTPVPVSGTADWNPNTPLQESTISAGGFCKVYYGFQNIYITYSGNSADNLHGPSAAIKTDGTLWLWGGSDNPRYQSTGYYPRESPYPRTPVQVTNGGTNWKSISSSGANFAAIKTDGTLWTWGNNEYGQLGDGTTTTNYFVPSTTSAGGTNWKQVSVGGSVVSAVKTDGTLWSWGRGVNLGGGTPGLGSAATSLDPLQISTTYTWNLVSVGRNMSAAVRDYGNGYNALYWWGGRSPASSPSSYDSVPVFINGSYNQVSYTSLSVGYDHLAAVDSNGALWMAGQIKRYARGSGSSDYYGRTLVTEFTPGNDWKQVSCSGDTTAAVKTDGTLWVWGTINAGLSGNNTWPYRHDGSIPTPVNTGNSSWTKQDDAYTSETPIPVPGNNWSQVSLVERSIMATKTDGTLWIWGARTQYDTNYTENLLGPKRVELDNTDQSIKDVRAGRTRSVWFK